MIAGGGFFARFVRLTHRLAWDAFDIANGAESCDAVRQRIGKYGREPIEPRDDPQIGSILLEEPFFLPEAESLPAPADFKSQIVARKGYSTTERAGLLLHQSESGAIPSRENLLYYAQTVFLG